jgi:membrane-bound metal-dependent hydrolase YbcI (DUF457 family)
MKGIAHFAVGVAVATFFPEVVNGAAQDLAFGPVLGGIAGLLPDTLDFKFLRYFERPDVVIDPARIVDADGAPDPQAMATQIAEALEQAYDSNAPVRVQLHSLKLGSDLWQRWSIALDPERSRVLVTLGPAVTTGQIPAADRTTPKQTVAQAPVPFPVRYTYQDKIQVDIFRGPSLALRRVDDGVEITFLPWHRAWTHSLLAVLLAGAAGSLLLPVYGLVMALAVVAHILADQLGHLGSNLAFPLTHRRTAGLGLIHSGDALPNFLAVWLSGAVILLNLDRFSAAPSIPVAPYVLVVILLPSLILVAAGIRRSRRRAAPRPPAITEIMDESSQSDLPF